MKIKYVETKGREHRFAFSTLTRVFKCRKSFLTNTVVGVIFSLLHTLFVFATFLLCFRDTVTAYCRKSVR